MRSVMYLFKLPGNESYEESDEDAYEELEEELDGDFFLLRLRDFERDDDIYSIYL